MVAILLSRKKQVITTADSSVMNVRGMFVKKDRQIYPLQEYTDFDTVTHVTFILVEKERFRCLPKLEKVQQATVAFLRTYHARQNVEFDCYAFANFVCGIKQHSSAYLSEFWKVKLHRRPKIGGIVFFTSKKRNGFSQFHHAAVYVGHGLYISVWGGGGDLELATLMDMKLGFGTQEVLSATPRT